MSCPTGNAPIDLTLPVSQPCSSMCGFTYDYDTASCSVTNNSTYLDIACFDGNNTIKSDLIGTLTVDNVRLYSPSLNKFNGQSADAEIIITHKGGGKYLYVCIPINSNEMNSASANWFKKVIPFSPTRGSGSSTSIRVNNFTLNDIMPQAPFTVFQNGTFDWNCDSNNVILLFHKNNGAINMKTRELRTLKSLIGKASYNLQTPKNLTFNKQGTLNGPSGSGPDPDIKGDNLTCTPITYPDGSDIGPTEAASLPWVGNKGTDDAKKGAVSALVTASPYIWLIIAFLGVMILMAAFGYAFSFFSKNKAAKAAALAGATGGGD